jgi:hypothetical protein
VISPSGRLLVVELDYLLDSKVCFSRAWNSLDPPVNVYAIIIAFQ